MSKLNKFPVLGYSVKFGMRKWKQIKFWQKLTEILTVDFRSFKISYYFIVQKVQQEELKKNKRNISVFNVENICLIFIFTS